MDATHGNETLRHEPTRASTPQPRLTRVLRHGDDIRAWFVDTDGAPQMATYIVDDRNGYLDLELTCHTELPWILFDEIRKEVRMGTLRAESCGVDPPCPGCASWVPAVPAEAGLVVYCRGCDREYTVRIALCGTVELDPIIVESPAPRNDNHPDAKVTQPIDFKPSSVLASEWRDEMRGGRS